MMVLRTFKQRKALWALGLLILVLVALGCFLVWRGKIIDVMPPEAPGYHSVEVPTHKLIYYEQQLFFEGVSQVKAAPPQAVPGFSEIRGGIIPHHLLPSFIFSDFFTRLQKQDPKRIILIGPNHKEKGEYKVLTSRYGWQTPFGVVVPDTKLVEHIIDTQHAYVNEPVLEDEHSVAGIMPYIKFYLPNARVVPLVLRSTLTPDETKDLAQSIAGTVDSDTVVVASVDFSHYLTADQAQRSDIVTRGAMQRFDYPTLRALNNDYVDSPPSIVTFLQIMQDLKSTSSHELYNTNSGLILHNPFIKTTSYFSIIYH